MTDPACGDSVVVLYKGGRLPSWDGITAEEQDSYSREHVDLMLSVAREHGLMSLEGFKLLAPAGDWLRFWAIEFPTFEGAEAWIAAEMEPPYGRYGYYEYYLARRVRREGAGSPAATPLSGAPSEIPVLEADVGSFVVVAFDRWLPGADVVPPGERGDAEHDDLMGAVAREHGHDPAGRLPGCRAPVRLASGPGRGVPGAGGRGGVDRGGRAPAQRPLQVEDVPPGAQVGAGVLRRMGSWRVA